MPETGLKPYRKLRIRLQRPVRILLPLLIASSSANAQFLMDMMDTTKELGKGLFSMYRRFDHIRISGYIQPQFQAASAEGAAGYSGRCPDVLGCAA